MRTINLFKEIYRQRRLERRGEKWSFSGPRVAFPEVYDFRRRAGKSALSREFRETLTSLLRHLEACWRDGVMLNVSWMFKLRKLGQELIRSGVRPEFVWAHSYKASARAIATSRAHKGGGVPGGSAPVVRLETYLPAKHSRRDSGRVAGAIFLAAADAV
jgi:hypothetical protein